MPEEQLQKLLLRFREGDQEAGEELFLQLKPLVSAYARRMAPRSGEQEDYVQAGMIGLLKAVRRFDPARKVKFVTFAVPWIEGEMRLYRRRNSSALKVSRSLQEQSRRLNSCRERLLQTLHREPSVAEIATALEMAVEEVALVMESCLPLSALEEETPAGPDQTGAEEKLLERLALREGLMKLAPLERQLIVMRFFDELTQAETAGRLTLSQRQVSRFEKRILRQLRLHMQPEG